MKRRLSQRLVFSGNLFSAFLVSVFGFSSSAYSCYEDARVLPQGRSRLSMTYAETGDISQTFGEGGDHESLTAQYNIQLNSSNIKGVSSSLNSLVSGLNSLPYKYNPTSRNAYDGVTVSGDGTPLGDALSRGFLGVGADAVETQYNIAFQYGLTDRLSVGFLLPIIHSQVSLNASVTGDNTVQNIQGFFNQPGMGSSLGSLAQPLNQLASLNVPTIQGLLQSKGYTVPLSTDQSGIGDLTFGGRYNYYKSRHEDVIASFQAGISAPTGALRDPTVPTQIDMGLGAFTLGIADIVNYSPVKWLTFSGSAHYDHFLPSSRNLITHGPNDPIPDTSNEENVAMQLGDRYWLDLGTSISLTKSLKLSAGYEWWWKRQDSYQGSNPSIDYSYLSFETNEYLETAQAGISFSTIPAFLRKDFPVPMDLALNIYVPTAGRNATIVPYGTAELAMYF